MVMRGNPFVGYIVSFTMSLNWVMLDDSRRPVPLPEEALSLSIPSADVTLNLHSAIAGGTTHTLRQLGTIYITNQRVGVGLMSVSQANITLKSSYLLREKPKLLLIHCPFHRSPSLPPPLCNRGSPPIISR